MKNIVRMKVLLLLLSIFYILFLGCSKDENIKTIKIDIENNKKIPAIKIQSVIPLQTDSNSIIGKINKLSLIDGNIYILDIDYTRTLFQFDSRGSYKAKTLVGKGPGELINPRDFYIDKQSKRIFIWESTSNKMKVFDLNLNHLYSNTYNTNIILDQYTRLPDSSWLAYVTAPDPSGLNSSAIYNYFNWGMHMLHTLN